MLIFFLGSLRGEQQNRADTSYRYQQSAKESAQRACVGTDPGAVFECVVEKAETAAQSEHDQRDLAAQQQAAWAGMLSSAWSFGALIATALGLYWIKGTLDATREAAEAAKDAVDETKRIGEAQTRAYLSVVRADFHVDRRQRRHPNMPEFELTLHLNNSGGTPAINVSYICTAAVTTWRNVDCSPPTIDDPTSHFINNVTPESPSIIAAICSNIWNRWGDIAGLWRDVTDETRFGDMPMLIIYGAVHYEDVFGQLHRSRYGFAFGKSFELGDKTGSDDLPRLQAPTTAFEPVLNRSY